MRAAVAAFGLTLIAAPGGAAERKTATFAGGCFWCMEGPFEKLSGVQSVVSGYTGGQKKNPTYEEVSSGGTGHTEAVQVVYDPAKVGYEKLLEVFWHNIDPLQANAQFCDRGKPVPVGDLLSRRRAEDRGRSSRRARSKPRAVPEARS